MESKREDLVAATKSLLWDLGYEAMSPKKIMRESGAGQGSLYHHFTGKMDRAVAALNEIEAEMHDDFDRVAMRAFHSVCPRSARPGIGIGVAQRGPKTVLGNPVDDIRQPDKRRHQNRGDKPEQLRREGGSHWRFPIDFR